MPAGEIPSCRFFQTLLTLNSRYQVCLYSSPVWPKVNSKDKEAKFSPEPGTNKPKVAELPTHAPPLTPTLGCSLADKMTNSIPMMNHSFRILARRPMFQPRGSPDHPAGPQSHQPDRSFTTPRLLLRSFSPSGHRRRATGATSGHVGHSRAVNTGGEAHHLFTLP